MTKKRLRLFRIFFTSSYLLATYCTLGIMPELWYKLNSIMSGKGVYLFYLLYSIAFLGVLYFMVFVRKETSLSNYLLLSLFVAVFFILNEMENNPGEKIHMAQYGIFGVLLYKTLTVDFKNRSRMFYNLAFTICFTAGAVDEIIQGFLPNRAFTWHDIFVNGVSGVVSVLIIRFNISPERVFPDKSL